MLLATLLHLLLLRVSSVILGAGPDLSYLSEIWGPPQTAPFICMLLARPEAARLNF
jgi:hypothetical protein